MMLDMALGGALVSILPKREWCATTQLSVSFISAARPDEKITASGNVVKRGKHVAHLEGKSLLNQVEQLPLLLELGLFGTTSQPVCHREDSSSRH